MRKSIATVAMSLTALLGGSTYGAEPVEQFLNLLQNEQLYDAAADYLNYIEKHNLLPKELKEDFSLLKLDVLQKELATINIPDKREQRIAEVQKGYEAFLAQKANHPRRGEARIRLADLYILQGDQAKQAATRTLDQAEKDTLLATARKAFQQAESLFTNGVQEMLEPLKAMLGGNIDPKDTVALARREAMQEDYRKSQIMIGLARKYIAETFPEDSPEFKSWMAKAEQQFNEVSSKASRTAEAGTYYLSVLYRGQSQAALKKVDEATESLLRVADLNEGGVLRQLQVRATASLVKLLASKESGKYETAVQRGETLLKQATDLEKSAPEWQELQLATLEAKDVWVASLGNNPQEENRARVLTKDIRDELQKLARLQGPVGDKSRTMLAKYGVELGAPQDAKIPRVRTFAEAYKEANDRVSKISQDKLAVQILENQLKAQPGNQGFQDQIAKAQAATELSRTQAIELYRRSFELFNAKEDSREDLATARFRSAYLSHTAEDHWNAATMGDLTARTNPGTEMGMNGAQIALYSYRQLLDQSEAESKPIHALQKFASYALEAWPNTDVSTSAATTVLQFALQENRIEDAEKAIDYLKKSSPKIAAQTQRDIGFLLYAKDFLTALTDAKNSSSAVDTPAIIELRERVENLLREGFEGLDASTLDERAVQAANALTDIYLRTDRTKEALETLEKAEIGPLAVVSTNSIPLSSGTKMESLRLSLQTEVANATANGAALNPTKIQELVAKMQAVAQEDGAEPALLTRALIVLANELKAQLNDAKSSADKQKLGNSLRLLLSQLISVSEDATVLQWSSKTLLDLSNGIRQDANVAALSTQMADDSVKGYEKLVQVVKGDASALQQLNVKLEDVQRLLASAYSSSGQYDKAASLYLDVLRSNNMMLLAQVEAAQNYQDWSKNTDADKLRNAMFGAEPGPKNQNIVWGWGRLSQRTANQANLEQYFFNARLQLAVCRAAAARTEADPAKKTKGLEAAIGDIRQTYITYPNLGGADTLKKFDDLTKTIQADLGQAPVGLIAFRP